MKRHSLLIITATALFCGIGFAFLPRPLDVLEEQATALKYSVRGTIPPDSSVLITYIDENAVRAIGWPLKRNFYALLLKTLSDLHVRAVGVEVMFEDANVEYPEYDELLAGVTRASGAVVLPAYFDGLEQDGFSDPDSVAGKFVFPGVRGASLRGKNIHLPIPSLLNRSAGVGHLNFVRDSDVPLFVA
jgi:CHASE2 domain-containing sensor protein